MTDQALRNHAFCVLDLVVEGTDETAKVYLLRLTKPQLEALGEVLNDVRAIAPRPVPGVASMKATGEVWLRAGGSRDLERTAPAVAQAIRAGLVTPVPGRPVAEMTITYNYREHFDFGRLDGRSGAESVPMLQDAARRLTDEADDDYWASTPGNAGHSCTVLLEWATMHPDAVWAVS